MKTWLGSLTLAAALLAGSPAGAQEPVSLYHAISVKDDVVIGISKQELEGEGSEGSPLDVLGDRIAGAGYVTAWLYGMRRGDDGKPEWAPQRRIIVLAANLVRIEPMSPTEKIVPPPNTAAAPGRKQ